ncbi:hypothetical protein [Borrelia miyamotoi]|nr:hypothetical protein [Borrelia miyamotoi]WVI04720.1 hypothetical protein F9Y91_06885 [Borrelia miyamotoi]
MINIPDLKYDTDFVLKIFIEQINRILVQATPTTPGNISHAISKRNKVF